MTFSRSNWQEAASIAAWLIAAFLVLAFVNAFRGAAPPSIPPTPQFVQRPESTHPVVTNDGRSAQAAQAAKTRRN
jgi:hypothetical protein